MLTELMKLLSQLSDSSLLKESKPCAIVMAIDFFTPEVLEECIAANASCGKDLLYRVLVQLTFKN